MATLRDIKKRMTAVGSIARITKTMQMIANAKFAAAMARAKATRPYSEKLRQLVGEVSAAAGDLQHPLIDGPAESPKRELLLAISSDRGLCGAYNANLLRKAMEQVKALRSGGRDIALEVSGKKAVGFFRFSRIPVANRHTIGDKPKYEEVERIASRMMEDFTAGKYDAVRIAYMRFESNARQIPTVLQLLPIEPPKGEQPLAVSGQRSAGSDATSRKERPTANYEFSPSAEELMAHLLPLSVKATLFQAFNDAVVSEQIMRMVAMKAATENAKELGRTLRRKYNRARQSKITTELTEIVSGAAALE